jgi:parallel beta-helix repeat protein
MGDDGIAIHGSYHLIVAAPNRTSVIVAVTASRGGTPALQEGERIWLYDPLLRPAVQVEVLSWVAMDDSYLPAGNPASKSLPKRYHQAGPFIAVRLAQQLPSSLAVGFDWLMSNTNRSGSGFIVADNVVKDNHARGMNLKASDGIVRNNLFSGNFHGGIVVAPELYWAEADYSRNLRIESNTVSEAGYAKWSYGAIGVGATIPHGQKGNGGGTTFASGAGHVSVSIVNNTVEDCDTKPILYKEETRAVFGCS